MSHSSLLPASPNKVGRAQTRNTAFALVAVTTTAMGAICWQQVSRALRLAPTSPRYAAVKAMSPPKSSGDRAAAAPAVNGARSVTLGDPSDPLTSTLAAYRAGQWREAEVQALTVIVANQKRPASRARTIGIAPVLRARRILAFSAARRHDMKTARTRFAQLASDAAAQKPQEAKAALPLSNLTAPGIVRLDTPEAIQADALYQHAVCTLALGDKASAEREWVALMRQFPESPLVHASVKRVARLHGGDIPKEADAAWKQAMATARAREQERERQASLCGPQTLVELLRRRGKPASVDALAKQMHTSEQGTSLTYLGQVAKRSGFTRADGFALTAAGLQAKLREAGPTGAVIALVHDADSGHFVLVDKAEASGMLTVWDSNGAGLNQPRVRTYSADQWRRMWQGPGQTGMALVLK